MTRIRAAVATAFGQALQIEELELRAPMRSEVQVRIEAVAICHSDITYLDGGWGGALPAVYGHEAAGVVEAVGDGATRFAPGDRVIVTLIHSCGTCAACGSSKQVYCSDFTPTPPVLTRPDGTEVWQALKCGAFAEKVVVDQSQLAALHDDVGFDVGCLLACGVPTGFGAAVNTAKVRPGDTVAVIGAGGVGLNAVQGAFVAGASRIVVLDLEPSKLEDAREFGATHGVLASDEKPWRAVKAATFGRGADHVFVSVGAKQAYDMAPRLLSTTGTVYAVGMPHSGTLSSYPPDVFAAIGQGIRGSLLGEVVLPRDMPWMQDLYAQGRLKLDELVSGRWSLDQINDAIDDTKKGTARRNVILM